MIYKMIFGLLGGLGLFIYGMKLMGDGLQKVAGEKLKKVIGALTSNRILGVLVGAGVTTLMQSSSATTVMVVGFVNAGLMTLLQAAGVIMGANIGTTMTAQLIAFNLTDIAPLILAIGSFMVMLAKSKRARDTGEILLGFGMLFIGMAMMQTSMSPVAKMEGFKNVIVILGQYPLMGVLAGLAMTATVQSSGATIGILMALAANSSIPLGVALPVLFGDNIGTCATALLSSIGTNKNAKRAAVMHLTFNIIGTVIFMFLLPVVLKIVPMMGGGIQRQIANAHTLFNVSNTIIQLPFAQYLVSFVNKIIPGKDENQNTLTLQYIDDRLLETPSIAVGQLMKEVVRMAKVASSNLTYSIDAFLKSDDKLVRKVEENEKVINFLEREITAFMVSLSNTSLSQHQSEIVTSLFHVVNDIERIGDHSDNLGELAEYKMDNKLDFSEKACDDTMVIYKSTKFAIEKAIEALENFNFDSAREVIANEPKIDSLEKQFRAEHIERLNKYICDPASGAIFLDLISNLERVGDHSNNIAQMVLEFE